MFGIIRVHTFIYLTFGILLCEGALHKRFMEISQELNDRDLFHVNEETRLQSHAAADSKHAELFTPSKKGIQSNNERREVDDEVDGILSDTDDEQEEVMDALDDEMGSEGDEKNNDDEDGDALPAAAALKAKETMGEFMATKWDDLKNGRLSHDPFFWITTALVIVSLLLLIVMLFICFWRLCKACCGSKSARDEGTPLLGMSNNNNADLLLTRLLDCKSCVNYHSKHHYNSSSSHRHQNRRKTSRYRYTDSD